MNHDDTDAMPAARPPSTPDANQHSSDGGRMHTAASRLAYPRMLSSTAVAELAGWSRRTLYNRIRDGIFPAAIATGPRTRAWLESDVLTFIDAQRAQRDERMGRLAVSRAADAACGGAHD